MCAYATVQQLRCHGSYRKLMLSLAQLLCRLSFAARPPAARPPAGNSSPNAVRFENSSKSTLAHDAVAAVVLHKHHPIILVGAGPIQFVYGPCCRLANAGYRHRNAISPCLREFFPQIMISSLPVVSPQILSLYNSFDFSASWKYFRIQFALEQECSFAWLLFPPTSAPMLFDRDPIPLNLYLGATLRFFQSSFFIPKYI